MAHPIRPTETVTLHFDLNHLNHLPDDQVYTMRGDGKGRKLVRHNAETRRAHAQHNLALAAMPEEHLSRLSHFCPDLELATDAVNWRWVGYQSSDPKALADDVAVVFQRVSSDHVRRAARAMRCEKGTLVPTMLSDYGVEVAGNNDHDELHVWASRIVAPIASALAIIMQHPDVGVLIPQTHHQIQLMLAQLTSIIPLWTYISTHPPGTGADPWYVQSSKGVASP
jgi:hypothetical protein